MHLLRIQKGNLDLSHWNLAKNGKIHLDGDWEFYYKQFYTSQDFKDKKNIKPELLKLPGYWNYENKFPEHGYATYRAIVNLSTDDGKRELGLYIPHAFTSYTLFINGKMMSHNGIPGKNINENLDVWIPQAAFFSQSEEVDLEVIIHVANYKSSKSGFRQSIELGTAEDILHYKQMLLAMDLFLVGSILIISLYHLGIYLLRRKELYLLYFFIYSFLLIFYKMGTGEYFIIMFFPFLSFAWMIRIFHLSIFLGAPFFSLFVNSLYKEDSNPVIAKILQSAFYLLSLLVPFSGIHTIENMLTVAEIFLLLLFVQVMNVFRKAIIHRRENAWGFLGGFVFVFATVINDILFEKDILHTEIYTPLGLFILIFSQSLFLARRFTNLFITVEEQGKELEKSADLKERLLNANIQSKRMELELLKKTIQPHFLMNSLAAIRCYLLENSDKSIKLLDSLTGELRIILQYSGKKHISILDEIQLCQYHLRVMAIRREKEYRLKIMGFSGNEVFPPMIYHTLLENAFTHEDESAGTLSFGIIKKQTNIELSKKIIYYCFIVINNSGNIKENKKDGSGKGLEYVKMRLEENWSGKWEISRGRTRNGYRVIIKIEE